MYILNTYISITKGWQKKQNYWIVGVFFFFPCFDLWNFPLENMENGISRAPKKHFPRPPFLCVPKRNDHATPLDYCGRQVAIKAGVHMKTSEIWSNIERELLGLKWNWKHYQAVDPLQKEPQVRRGLFGIRLLILHFKFQFSKSIRSSTFHIFLNLTYPLRKNISFPKHPKILHKTAKSWLIK